MQTNGSTGTANIIRLDGIKKHYPVLKGIVFQKTVGLVKAVDGISLAIPEGQTYSLVGESGCGKTTTSRQVLMVEKPTEGEIYFQGKAMGEFSNSERREFHSSVQAVFQDPWSSLNPRMRVDSIVSEPLITHQNLTKQEVKTQVGELLEVVGLHAFHAERYPHEFSGGQRQRIAIARALSTRPKLIVLDEPVSALDVSIRAQILNLLKELQKTFNLSYLLIAHNLATVRYMSHRVGVMYLGKIIEEASPGDIFTNPLHPYTKALISASLPAHPNQQREEIVLTGEVPSPLNPPGGCTFHPRCPVAFEPCSSQIPVIQEVTPSHLVNCHLFTGAEAPN
ncbi:MAG: ATP-binding cassette domain-containing protein [Chloroflexi bacterium]|nr:ATP-binding cassette domain-containing protein [Chloroflexota bacterium]MDA1228211.1 ATP-binding cassette domain-containing protein [Chloroflexota bacterium]